MSRKETPIDNVKCYVFSTTANLTPPQLEAKSVEEFLYKIYNSSYLTFGLNDLKEFGIYKYLGWAFDFKPYLRRFVIKTGGSWRELYAPNKEKLRIVTHARISEIVELENKYRGGQKND